MFVCHHDVPRGEHCVSLLPDVVEQLLLGRVLFLRVSSADDVRLEGLGASAVKGEDLAGEKAGLVRRAGNAETVGRVAEGEACRKSKIKTVKS